MLSSIITLRHLANNIKVMSQILCHGYCDCCTSKTPFSPPPPGPSSSPPRPPYADNPRTKYEVRFIYVNDVPPSTKLNDFVDRAAQTVFWSEIIRG